MQRRQQRNAKPGNSKHVPKANQNSDMRASLKRKAKRGTTEPRPRYSEGSEADHRKPPPPPFSPGSRAAEERLSWPRSRRRQRGPRKSPGQEEASPRAGKGQGTRGRRPRTLCGRRAEVSGRLGMLSSSRARELGKQPGALLTSGSSPVMKGSLKGGTPSRGHKGGGGDCCSEPLV